MIPYPDTGLKVGDLMQTDKRTAEVCAALRLQIKRWKVLIASTERHIRMLELEAALLLAAQTDAAMERALTGLNLRGVWPPFNAIEMFLQHAGTPQKRQTIVRALIISGARLGANPAKSVNQAISANVRIGKLREPKPLRRGRGFDPNNLVGLPFMFRKNVPNRPPSTGQQRCINAFAELEAKHGLPPTLQELADRLGITRQSASEQVNTLVTKGFIRRANRRSRGFELIPQPRSLRSRRTSAKRSA